MTTILLYLPIPVTINKAYSNKLKNGGRTKTIEAKNWYHRALYYAAPYIREHKAICEKNVLTRQKYMTARKRLGGMLGMRLAELKADHPNVGYQVTYTYHFSNDGIRDVFNFEKLLTDMLVECGFMLDDNFIIDGRVRWGKLDPVNPHVEVQIISLDRATAI